MNPSSRSWLLLTLFPAFLLISTLEAEEQADSFSKTLRPILMKRCVHCHGQDGEVNGEVNLLNLQTEADVVRDLETLREVIRVLDNQEMPPEYEPELKDSARGKLVVEFRKLLHEAVAKRSSYAYAPIRRMNRFQYNNAVKDLFALKVEVFPLPEKMLRDHSGYFRPETGCMPPSLRAGCRPLGKSQLIEPRLAGVAPFPQDLRAEHGFDNRGDHLSLSPLLMESFLRLSHSIVSSPDFNRSTVGIWNEFFAEPNDKVELAAEVKSRLQMFLTHAFRGQVQAEVLARYQQHILRQIEAGTPFSEAMKNAAAAVLCSPRFLYLYDTPAKENEPEPLDHYELASRLSFFLWGSIPDQTLLQLAEEGKLQQQKVLRTQVQRMLKDRRLKRFCDSFPAQWLQLDRIISSMPDDKLYPQFVIPPRYRSSMHMVLEPLLLFETVLIENRSLLELIDPKFSYRSQLLDSWYRNGGKSKSRREVTAVNFRRIPIKDRRQGGVITNAAVMTMTSNPTRTQPITRGAWVATVIFNNPPEPPPADVPPLEEEDSEEAENLTLRERLDLHRTRADCASCHAKIDPLGFALENYNAVGVWREKYRNGLPIDVSGKLFRKHEFETIVEFKDAILKEKDRFARAFAAHLLSFALARPLGAADDPALAEILSKTAEADYRLQALLEQIVLSKPFRFKTSRKP